MIPVTLKLTNFLSYRQPTLLDFHGIHLACISGANGAGKSTILDAIIWALFGRSRAKSDDDLVNRLGAINDEAAEVIFVFELEGISYRVLRRKKVRRTTLLELQIATDGGKWKSLSEGKLRETQSAIESLLRMSYDTFVNASFLLQGKADEFTTKTPDKRKEILADLLGVNEWDRYKEMATERRKMVDNQIILLDGRLQDIEEELGQLPERKADLDAARTAQERVSERLSAQEKLVQQVRRTEAAIKQQEHAVRNLAENLSRAQETLANLIENRARRQKERDGYQALLDQSETVAADYTAWQEVDATLKAWTEKADAYNKLQGQKRPHELEIERERSRLTQRKTELEAQSLRVTAMRDERLALAGSLSEAHSKLNSLLEQLAGLTEQEQAWHEARSTLQQLLADRRLLKQEADQLRAQAKRVKSFQEERTAVTQNVGEAEVAIEQISNEIAIVESQQKRLMLAMADLDRFKKEQPGLRQEMNEARDRIDRLKAGKGDVCPLCGQPLSERHKETVLLELESSGKQMADRFRDNKSRIEELQAEVNQLTDRVKQSDLLERNLKAQEQRLTTTTLRLAEIDRVVDEWRSAGASRLTELETKLADDVEIKKLNDKVTILQKAVEDKSALQTEYQEQQRLVARSEARLGEIDRVIAEWERSTSETGEPLSGTVAELENVSTLLVTEKFAPDARLKLALLDQQAAEIKYDADIHNEIKDQWGGLADAQTRYQELQIAEAAVKPLDDTLADLDVQIKEAEESAGEFKRRHAEAEENLATLSTGEASVETLEQELFNLREEEISAHRSVAAAQQRVDVLDQLHLQRRQVMEERIEMTQVIQRLKLLEKACGREGVQALLIERALPEIEDDANELLDRLTGGNMQVVFDTQKKLKTSERLAETLDIRIVDSAGERPYENFSGGEQFRVNFAIRLALSKILAKRAGARLQTLVIDEGFGSQDPVGRQRLVEAINVIKDDFERVLVITHIDELRDAFPTRIEVEKSSIGSEITVV